MTRRDHPDLIVLDLMLPGGTDGLDVCRQIRRDPGRAFSRTQLVGEIYDVAYEGYDRAIDSHVSNLRQEIEPDPRELVLLHGGTIEVESTLGHGSMFRCRLPAGERGGR